MPVEIPNEAIPALRELLDDRLFDLLFRWAKECDGVGALLYRIRQFWDVKENVPESEYLSGSEGSRLIIALWLCNYDSGFGWHHLQNLDPTNFHRFVQACRVAAGK